MTGFFGMDRFDQWVLLTGLAFVGTTGWFVKYAPHQMSGTLLLLLCLLWLMGSLVVLILRYLLRAHPPFDWKKAMAAKPVHNLHRHSTMSRWHWANAYSHLDKAEALRRLVIEYKMSIPPIDFTVDRWDAHYDHGGVRREAGQRYDDSSQNVVIYWYDAREAPLPKPKPITPLPAPPKKKTKKPTSRGGLGSSAIHHGISKRASHDDFIFMHRASKRRSDFDNAPNFSGFSHVSDVIPGRYVAGTTAALDMGYNREPTEWPKPGAAVIDKDGELHRIEWLTGAVPWNNPRSYGITREQREAAAQPKTVDEVIDRIVESGVHSMEAKGFKDIVLGYGISREDYNEWMRESTRHQTLDYQSVMHPKQTRIFFNA